MMKNQNINYSCLKKRGSLTNPWQSHIIKYLPVIYKAIVIQIGQEILQTDDQQLDSYKWRNYLDLQTPAYRGPLNNQSRVYGDVDWSIWFNIFRTHKLLGTVTIFGDNKTALILSERSALFYPRTKHFMREMVADGNIRCVHTQTQSMIADYLTKTVPFDKHKYCRDAVNVSYNLQYHRIFSNLVEVLNSDM